MKKALLAIVFAMLIGAPAAHAEVVPTSSGAVRGITRTNYDAWLGIPYAQPPVGNLRFKAPVAVQRWLGVRDATHFGGRCTQNAGWDPGYEEPISNEDCLYLNVYAPHERGKHPVLVWIHGGGFTGGGGAGTPPPHIVDPPPPVVVAIHYPPRALGLLHPPPPAQEGGG